MSLLDGLDKSQRFDAGGVKWWEVGDDTDPATDVWATVRRHRNRQSWRRESDELALRLYSDCRIVGYRSNSSVYDGGDVLESRQGDNMIRSIARTIHSKVCRQRPRPVVLTEGAKWGLKKKAEMLDVWINGKMTELHAYTDIFPQAVLHALVFGTGIVRSYGDPDTGAALEVVPSYEVVVDDSEARYGTPRTIYIVRVCDRKVLMNAYPDKKDILLKSGSSTTTQEFTDVLGRWDSDRDVDLLVTVEAFRLPSGPKAKDGRHVICVDNGALLDERWKRDHFPLAIIRAERRPIGFWGIGLAEDLAGAQLELIRTILARQEMIRLLSVPFWLVERGSKVVKSHISNLIGRIVEYSGTPPQLVTPNAVPAELWQHADNIKKTMFESRGVSQLTAQAIKPAGLNSGRALRTYTDLESELLVDFIRSYEQLVLDCAELLIEEQEDLGHEYQNQAVTVIGRGKIESITWSKARLPKEKFMIQIVPSSSLSASISGRIEDIYDLRDLGAITDPEEIRDLLDMPDLKRQGRRTMAHRELLLMTIEQKILTNGMSITPEPTWDLALAMKLGLQLLMEAETYEDIPPQHLDRLREFIAMCSQLMKPETVMAPPVPGPGEGQPMMPPESPMMPTGEPTLEEPQQALPEPGAVPPGPPPTGQV